MNLEDKIKAIMEGKTPEKDQDQDENQVIANGVIPAAATSTGVENPATNPLIDTPENPVEVDNPATGEVDPNAAGIPGEQEVPPVALENPLSVDPIQQQEDENKVDPSLIQKEGHMDADVQTIEEAYKIDSHTIKSTSGPLAKHSGAIVSRNNEGVPKDKNGKPIVGAKQVHSISISRPDSKGEYSSSTVVLRGTEDEMKEKFKYIKDIDEKEVAGIKAESSELSEEIEKMLNETKVEESFADRSYGNAKSTGRGWAGETEMISPRKNPTFYPYHKKTITFNSSNESKDVPHEVHHPVEGTLTHVKLKDGTSEVRDEKGNVRISGTEDHAKGYMAAMVHSTIKEGHDIESLVAADANLTEEFQAKAKELFDARVAEATAKLQEEFNSKLAEATQKLEEEKQDFIMNMSEKIDTYLDAQSEKWVVENRSSVEMTAKLQLLESFMAGIKGLYESHNMLVPEGKIDLVEDLQKQVGELTAIVEENKATIDKMTAEQVLAEQAKGMTDLDQARLQKLCEDIEYSDADEYRARISVIKEQFFAKRDNVSKNLTEDKLNMSSAPILESNAVESAVNPNMQRYIDFMKRHSGSK